jgi:hypothetical protein
VIHRFNDIGLACRRVRPALAPVIQPVQQQSQSEVIEGSDSSSDGQAAVADVGVVEPRVAICATLAA